MPMPGEFSAATLLGQLYRATLKNVASINKGLVQQYYQAVSNYNQMAKMYWSDQAVMGRVKKPTVPLGYTVVLDVDKGQVSLGRKPVCDPLPLWKHEEQPAGQVVFGQEVDFPVPGSRQATGMVNGKVKMTTVPPGTVKQYEGRNYRLQKFNVPVGYVLVWVPLEGQE